MLQNFHTVRVEFGDCDPTGMVFHPRYFAWFDASFHALMRSAGTSLQAMQADFGIHGIPLVESHVRFHHPSGVGDLIDIKTAVTSVHRCMFNISHHIHKQGILIVQTSETRAWTVLDPDHQTVRAHPIPDQVQQILSMDNF